MFLWGNRLPCRWRITCQKDQIDPKKAFPKELDTNLSLKENQIIKKKNISNTSLSNAKTEKEKQIKNDPKRTSK